MNLLEQLAQHAGTARILAGTGIIRPTRPDKLVRDRPRAAALGPDARRRLHRLARSATRTRPAIIDELGHADLRGGPRAHERARPRAAATPGIGEGDGVAILCRNHRGFIDATVACSKLGATRSTSTRCSRRRRSPTSSRREKPVAIVYDEEFEELVDDAAQRRKRFIALARRPSKPARTRCSRTSSRDGDPSDLVAARGEGPRRHPHLRARPARRRAPQRKQPDSLDPAAALFSQDPAARRASRR